MMPEMVFLYQIQNRFGHHKWCRIFSINRSIQGLVCLPTFGGFLWEMYMDGMGECVSPKRFC